MIKRTLIFFLLISSLKGVSQNFGTLPYISSVVSNYAVERLVFDSIHNKLLISSKFMNYAANKFVRGICSWDGLVYDSLSSGLDTHDTLGNQANSTVICGIPYNGKLLVGGTFQSIGGVNATSLATWDGTKWDSLPVRAFQFLGYNSCVYGFLRYNNKLYIHGQFSSVQGQPANGLATFDGTSFQPVNVPLQPLAEIIDMKVYKGELYISGNFSYTLETGNYDVLKFDGTNWVSMGGGIKGGGSGVGEMAIYNNELYVGGYFTTGSGNLANVIMKWDGTAWHDAGWGNPYNNGAIWQLLVHHNKLYAFGSFDMTANVKSSKVTVFDGNNWCTFADSLNNTVLTAAVYRDTIYFAGGFNAINGDTARKNIAKIIQPEVHNNCVNVVGIKEISNGTQISIYPNPASSVLNIPNEQNELTGASIEITNNLGQSVYIMLYSGSIDVSTLPGGCYYLTARKRNGEAMRAKFVKE